MYLISGQWLSTSEAFLLLSKSYSWEKDSIAAVLKAMWGGPFSRLTPSS